jgi:hypothetical protein
MESSMKEELTCKSREMDKESIIISMAMFMKVNGIMINELVEVNFLLQKEDNLSVHLKTMKLLMANF